MFAVRYRLRGQPAFAAGCRSLCVPCDRCATYHRRRATDCRAQCQEGAPRRDRAPCAATAARAPLLYPLSPAIIERSECTLSQCTERARAGHGPLHGTRTVHRTGTRSRRIRRVAARNRDAIQHRARCADIVNLSPMTAAQAQGPRQGRV